MTDDSTLAEKEPHPAAESALTYLNSLGLEKLLVWQEAFSSLSIEGNRLAEVCSGTLSRLTSEGTVSDRYLLGLAWTIQSMEQTEEDLKDE